MTNENATTEAKPADLILAACTSLGLTLRTEFVPFSLSRNAKNDRDGTAPSKRSLNWRVTLERNGRDVLTTDYSAGIGHCPSYDQRARWTLDYTALIVHETEKGTRARPSPALGGVRAGAPIHPEAASVIASLVLDSSVLDAGGFEEWASEYGYDADSRAAEAIYRACLEHALKMRAAIGDAGLETLRTACEDY